MGESIPIDDSMPESLKNAISYLNEKNISLDEEIDENAGLEPEEDVEDFNGYVSAEDEEDTEVIDDDEIIEGDVDLSDLDDMF